MLPGHLVDLLVHFVSCFNDLGIGLIGPLADDEADELFDDTDVRGFNITLLERAETFLATGIADGWFTARVGGCKQVSAGTAHSGGIGEIGELYLSGDLRRSLAGLDVADCAILRDGDALGLGWNRDLRLDGIAVGGDEVAIAVQVEVACPRVSQLAAWHSNLEEAASLDDDIHRIFGALEVALAEDDLVGTGPRAKSELETRGDYSLGPGGGSGLNEVLVQQVLKLGTALLEAYGVGIGQVVCDVVDVHLLGRHSACCAVECSDHLYISPLC